MRTTVGQYLLNDLLPEDLRDHQRVWDKSGQAATLKQLATDHPDQYRETVKRLSDFGRHAAYTTGGYSFDLKHLAPTPTGEKLKAELSRHVQQILNDDTADDKGRQDALVDVSRRYLPQIIEGVLSDSVKSGNPLAKQLKGAGRGDKAALNRLLGADVLYVDAQGKPIPVPVLHSYSQGLTPEEYFAGSSGARQGIIQTKLATAKGGFLAKQLTAASHRLVVTSHDSDEPDSGQLRGLPTATNDPDNEGALLAAPIGRYQRNTVLTPRILKELQTAGHEQLLVRSPMVGGPPNGGLYGRDVGVREKGHIEPTGSYAGVTAANSLAEPVTQLNLKSKHTGGAIGALKQGPGSFDLLNNLIQVPEQFPGGAVHAQLDGKVRGISPAPQGGFFVNVDHQQHYVPGDQEVTAKLHDDIEAGDTLSDGLPNPAEIVKHKGIGEGRKYFTDAFRSVLAKAGSYGHRRNIELVARGLINHVRLTDEVGDWSPDDVVPYSMLEHSWQSRPGSLQLSPQRAKNHFIEQPVLHYTIGTRVTPSVQKNLQKFGVSQIEVHPDPPPFVPEMQRAMTNVTHDPDWNVRFLGGYQEKSLLDAVHRGGVSDTQSTSFVPALTEGATFGKHLPPSSKSILD